jgi:tetratricopeptide (TPR) repeat protein
VKKTHLGIPILILLSILPRNGHAQSATIGLYQQGNEAYQNGDYQKAIQLYQQILESGVTNGAALYNLGNAYFKDNQLGRAILFYERAKRLLPRDRDVAANLALANQLTLDKITTDRGALWIRGLTWPSRTLNISELTWITFGLYLMTAALVAAVIWTRKIGFRKKILVASLIAGVLLVVVGASLLGNIYQQRKVPKAIVLTPVQEARSGPGQEYTKIFTVHEGTKVRIRQEREGWYLISLPNGLGGWIPGNAVEII